MSQVRIAAYRSMLGERFRPDAALEALMLKRADADKLLEALAEAVAEERGAAGGEAAEPLPGLRLGAGFGAQAPERMAAEIGGGAGAEAVAARWAARGFGASVLSSAGPAVLFGREAVIADPVPALISAGRTAPGGWPLAAGFAASAIRAVAALSPVVEAGAARLVDPTAPWREEEVKAPAPEPRARRERAGQWARLVRALGGGGPDAGALELRTARILADYDAARLGGAPFDPMYGPAAAAAAETYLEMIIAARLADPRIGAELEGLPPLSARKLVAEALWSGSADPEEAPRLGGAQVDGAHVDGALCPIWRLDLGPAPDPARLPLAEAAALRLGEETLSAQRELAEMALTASARAGPEGVAPATRAEMEEAAAALAAGASAVLARGATAAAFQAGWRAELLMAPGCGVFTAEDNSAAASGLADVAGGWPELALLTDLAAARAGEPPCGAALLLRSP